MLVRVLYWITVVLLLRFVIRAVLRAAAPGSPPLAHDAKGGPVYKGLMVRDPVCGLHLPESRALVERRGGESFHFCSSACLTTFRAFRNSGS